MREVAGRIIDFVKENEPVRGCTVSKQIYQDGEFGISVFSLGEHTSITAESYEYHKIIQALSGSLDVFDKNGKVHTLGKGESILTLLSVPIGTRSEDGCIYMEISFRKEDHMNELLKAGKVFQLAELVPYQEGKIVNMDLVSDPKMKFVVMSFDEGTGLSEHAAPGEALVFALDGEGVIGYEGKEYVLKAGETFKFDKMGKHSVKAKQRFKMALLLVLE